MKLGKFNNFLWTFHAVYIKKIKNQIIIMRSNNIYAVSLPIDVRKDYF